MKIKIHSLLLLLFLGLSLQIQSAHAENNTEKEGCFDLLREQALSQLNHDLKFKTWPEFLANAETKTSNRVDFSTTTTEPLFSFQQIRYGKRVIQEGQQERLATLLNQKVEAPAFRTTEHEVNFLESTDPETGNTFFEHCGYRKISPLNPTKNIFNLTQEELGLNLPPTFSEVEILSKKGQIYKIVLATRIMQSPDGTPLYKQEGLSIFPKNYNNHFYNLYDLIDDLKKLFEKRAKRIEKSIKRGRFELIQVDPEIKEDKVNTVRLINGKPTSNTYFRGIREKFYARIALRQKSIIKYLSTFNYQSPEEINQISSFMEGTSPPPQELPQEVKALPRVNKRLAEYDEMLVKNEECVTPEQKKNLENEIENLNKEFSFQSEEDIYSAPDSIQNDYISKRWEIENKHRNQWLTCVAQARTNAPDSPCELSPEALKEMNRITQQHNKSINIMREGIKSGKGDSEKMNKKIKILEDKLKTKKEKLLAPCMSQTELISVEETTTPPPTPQTNNWIRNLRLFLAFLIPTFLIVMGGFLYKNKKE